MSELFTCISEVQRVVNERPLISDSVDPDADILTPNKLMFGYSLTNAAMT